MAATVSAPAPARRRFSIEEYYRLAEAGILKPNERVELIAGEIYTMSAVGVPHARCVTTLTNLLAALVQGQALVSVQSPIRLEPDSEPEPDLAVVRRDWTWRTHPTPAAILLLIEVADTSLLADRRLKLPLHAAAGIAETWLVDLNGEVIERYSEPGVEGYGRVVRAGRGQALTSTVLPAVTLDVDTVLD